MAMKKFLSVLLKILGVILCIPVILISLLSIAKVVCYPTYVANTETVCTIPAIHEGFVPQGVAHVLGSTYLFTGYNGDAMEIYLSRDGEAVEIVPVDADGKVYDLHGGGVAVAGKYVYITGDKEMLVFYRDAFLNAKNGDKVSPIKSFETDVKTSFCFADADYLYVGEFYDGNKYKTDAAHHLTTPAGEKHYALAAAYPLTIFGELATESPEFFLSIRDKVQGFAVHEGVFMVSCSYGLTSSDLDFYRGYTDNGSTINLGGLDTPVYFLDSKTHTEQVKMPAFSEGLDVVDGRVVISFESACNKYVVGKLFFADKLVSYPIPKA